MLHVLEEAGKGWLQAQRVGSRERGFVPESFVARMEEEEEEEEAAPVVAEEEEEEVLLLLLLLPLLLLRLLLLSRLCHSLPFRLLLFSLQAAEDDEIDPSIVVGCDVVSGYDWVGDDPTCNLNLRKGERLRVLKLGQGGWLKGRNARGLEGFFPASFVSPAQAVLSRATSVQPADPAPAPPAATARRSVEEVFCLSRDSSYVQCTTAMVPHQPTHMRAEPGEVIMVVKEYSTGWWRGVSHSGSRVLFIP